MCKNANMLYASALSTLECDSRHHHFVDTFDTHSRPHTHTRRGFIEFMYNDRSSSTHTRVCAPYNIRSQVCTRSEGVDGCRPHPGRTISPAVRILCIHMCAERACVDDVDDGATTAYTHSCTLICEQRASVVLRVVGGMVVLRCSGARARGFL